MSHSASIRLPRRSAGFSLTEVFVVVAVIGVISAIALPRVGSIVDSYRLSSSVAGLAGELNVAKLKATSQLNPYQLQINVTAGTYQRYVMTSSPGVLPRTFAPDPGSAPAPLPGTVSFGFGSVTVPAGSANEQPSLAQATAITFNSMGVPVDANGQPTAANAIYVTYNGQTAAVTVSLAGRIEPWTWTGTQWVSR